MDKFLSVARQRQRGLIVVLEDPDRQGVLRVGFRKPALPVFGVGCGNLWQQGWMLQRFFEGVMLLERFGVI